MQDNLKNINDAIPSLPFDDVWAGLKPELDAEAKRREKRKRRFIIFWLSLVIIGLGGGILMFNNEHIIKDGKRKNEKSIANYEQKEESVLKSKNQNVEEQNVEINEKQNMVEGEKKILSNKQRIANVELVAKQSKTKDGLSKTNQKIETKTQHTSGKVYAFKNVKSFTNLSQYKKENEAGFANNTFASTGFINDAKNNLYIASNSIKSIDTVVSSKDSTKIIQPLIATNNQTTNKKEQKQKIKISYGLQWNVPVFDGANSFDINATKQPTTLLIPQFWVSKTFGKKHSLMLAFNPYSQYYFNNKAVVDFNKYNVTINTGSQAVTAKPNEITYTESTAFNKLIAMEASLMYQYQLSTKIKIGAGVSCNWLQGASMQNKIIKNYTLTTRDSLYGVDKSSKEWSYLNSSYVLGKFEILYQIKRMNFGVCFSKPISNVFVGSNQYKTPINTNLFVRWSIK